MPSSNSTPAFGEVLARLLQGRVVGQLPADAGQLVLVGGEDHQSRGDLVDPVVQVVGVGPTPLGEAEHLAGEQLPRLEVGAGDPGVAHAADVDVIAPSASPRGGPGTPW